jgi:DNA-binding NarL/FixJ family response regulator
VLTPQEDRILDFIADGLTNREIAERLHLSEKTVKNYVSEIYSKLNVERRSQAATMATERRLRKQQ